MTLNPDSKNPSEMVTGNTRYGIWLAISSQIYMHMFTDRPEASNADVRRDNPNRSIVVWHEAPNAGKPPLQDDTITPYPTGRAFRGGAVPGTSCQATIAPSLRGLRYVMRPATS